MEKVRTFEYQAEGDNLLLIRNKHPKLVIKIEEECDVKQLADALKSASEFVRKNHLIK